MKKYNFKVRLINEEFITVEANDFDEAVEKADYEASKLAYGHYESYAIDEEGEE